ncbi:AMP-binding protein [Diaminobutyricimonas sp. LJ205]|uniref:AMP-binding protein n=1 Tax=Diaminobutyricimonas sp. LJ205 TaxID=2683590 RepID=UPI0012F4A677|nr:AMP-binding protein [Diaminobutyricimonas sp. LJ205]
MPLTPSAHLDTFARDNLPPEHLWPTLEFTLPELQYPERLNAADFLLDHTVARFGPDQVALRAPVDQDWGMPEDQGNVWTYGELQNRVNQVARLLTEDYGIVPGNRVLLRIPNNPWAVITWLAVVKAGAIAVTTMVAWRHTEISKVAERTRPSLAVADHRFASELEGSIGSDVSVVILGGLDDQLIGASATKLRDFVAVETAADDVVLLGSTSGTTGEPKITAHFHRDILAIADTFAHHTLGIRPDDVIAGSPPLAFTFGLGGLVIFPMRFGASTFLIERTSPAALADAIEHEGVNVLFTAPTGYRTMLKEGREAALGKLRVGVSAGEHLPKETFDAVEQACGLRLIDGIGATEMLHVFISASGDDIRPGATGKAVPGFRAMVLDDDGKELAAGELGRLAVIGPTGCRYLADDRQSAYVQNGWNITGDTYRRDEDGYFTYAARSDDMIVASGYNVGAPEVEAVIDTHPSVIESAVVARPDPDKGAIVSAFVVLHPGVPEDDLIRESIQQTVRANLAPYKIPRRIDFVDVLPRNPSGKLQRFPLRQRAQQEAAALIQVSEGTTQ